MKNTFKFTRKEDKHIFAGLFNTAMNNFELSLRELNKRMNCELFKETDTKKEQKTIEFAFHNERPQIEFDNNFNYLSESFIFLKKTPSFLKKYNRDFNKKIVFSIFIKDFLLDLYNILDDYRNYYTHYEHEEIVIKNKLIFHFLDYILFNSISRIKDDKVKTDLVKKKLLTKYETDFITIIKEKNDWTSKENIKLKEKGKDPYSFFKIDSEKGRNYALNSIFRDFIDDSTKKPKFKENISNVSEDELTHFGFIQFLALFLNRKQVNILFDHVSYTLYDNNTELQKLITRWFFSYECYRDIKNLFKSDYDNNALLLQIVSELTKCPQNLYPYLSDNNKNEFLEDINSYLKDNTSIFDDDALVTHEVLNKRYENKFKYFAIRFLDEFANFPSLRFQVNMGKFNHDTREKIYKSTNKKTQRKILEKIIVFENLSKATLAKNKYFEKLNADNKTKFDLSQTKDWVEHPRPKYQFFGNSIGIWIDIKELENYSDIEKERKEGKLTKLQILDKLKLKDKFKKPIAYLSVYELPALLYAILIENKKGSDIENIIKGRILKQRNFINNLTTDKTYNEDELKKLPKKIKTILNSESTINWDKIEKQLKEELNVEPLKDIRKYYNKQPKNVAEFSLKEKGKIATWLSKDIKRFTDKKTKEGWKGYKFAEFQSLLSYYDVDHRNLNNYLFKDLNFDATQNFAFKNGIKFSKKSLYEFYTNYLANRKIYIQSLLDNFHNIDAVILLQPFKASKFKIDSLKIYKEKKLKEPVMLARGIFDDKPTIYNKDKGDKPEFANWFKASMKSNNAQEFYNFNKYYPLTERLINQKMTVSSSLLINNNKGLKEQFININKIKDKFILTNEQIKTTKSKEDKYGIKQKEVYKNEARLRKTMRNDFYILQMIKYYFKTTSEIDNKNLSQITLKDFYLTKVEKEKIKKESATQSVRNKGDKSDFVFNDSYILNKPIKLKLLGGKIICNVALKETSKYKKITQDKRVEQLTKFYNNKIWNIEEIEREIHDYELIRSKTFFKQIHQLEKIIFIKATKENKEDELNRKNNIPSFKQYLIYYFLNDQTEKDNFKLLLERKIDFLKATEKSRNLFLLIELRNKFSHNQFISVDSYNYLKNLYKKDDDERIATYLNRVFNKIIDTTKKLVV